MEEGCSRRGAVCFKSLVLFTLLLYVCTAKAFKEQNIWSLTELLFDSCITYCSLGSATLSNNFAHQKASAVYIRCTEMALDITLSVYSHKLRESTSSIPTQISSMLPIKTI